MNTTTAIRKNNRLVRPVYALLTGADSIEGSVLVGRASSKTAAIAQCRAAGLRVMTVGGNIGLESRSAITASDSDDLVWAVTVWAVTVYA